MLVTGDSVRLRSCQSQLRNWITYTTTNGPVARDNQNQYKLGPISCKIFLHLKKSRDPRMVRSKTKPYCFFLRTTYIYIYICKCMNILIWSGIWNGILDNCRSKIQISHKKEAYHYKTPEPFGLVKKLQFGLISLANPANQPTGFRVRHRHVQVGQSHTRNSLGHTLWKVTSLFWMLRS